MGSTGRELVSSQHHSLQPPHPPTLVMMMVVKKKVITVTRQRSLMQLSVQIYSSNMKDGSRGGEGGGAPHCRVGQDSLSRSVLPHNAHLDSFIHIFFHPHNAHLDSFICYQTSEQHQSFCNFTAFPISFGSKSLYFRNYNLLTCFHVPASSI